jgi:hypothetical protein
MNGPPSGIWVVVSAPITVSTGGMGGPVIRREHRGLNDERFLAFTARIGNGLDTRLSVNLLSGSSATVECKDLDAFFWRKRLDVIPQARAFFLRKTRKQRCRYDGSRRLRDNGPFHLIKPSHSRAFTTALLHTNELPHILYSKEEADRESLNHVR